ncbi:protein of unknown function (plasmid) [Vibrio tapetis subsp. tapetis]|uniref:Uncharacterized protein n=1 Tax=Vibrio tapetis subsp. tapetis TaxID=1671868 RepID=A0A2N8ZNL7_9VIBR|nr:protein of unknown function [Vibrio tapetis subsp. tapetis]
MMAVGAGAVKKEHQGVWVLHGGVHAIDAQQERQQDRANNIHEYSKMKINKRDLKWTVFFCGGFWWIKHSRC